MIDLASFTSHFSYRRPRLLMACTLYTGLQYLVVVIVGHGFPASHGFTWLKWNMNGRKTDPDKDDDQF